MKTASCFRCKQSPKCESGRIWVWESDPYWCSPDGKEDPGGYYKDCLCTCHGEFCPICETQHPKGQCPQCT